MAQLNFDASQVTPDAGVAEAIPAGWYNVMIDESEMKPTKDGNGAFLAMRFTVLDGQFVNRKVFTRLNLRNANPVAQEIAYKQLSAICHAVGVMQVADSTQLHGRPLKIKVKVRAASGDYEASNEISAYKNINEQVEGPTGQAPAAGGAPWGNAQAAAPAAPWAPQQPTAVAPAQQFAPQQPAAAAPAPAWQPPAAQQPWQAAPAAAPAQAPAQQFAPASQAAPVQQPAQQPAQAPAAGATPPWMQQAAAQAPAATPPWAAPAQG
jgi:hypothetical protein